MFLSYYKKKKKWIKQNVKSLPDYYEVLNGKDSNQICNILFSKSMLF